MNPLCRIISQSSKKSNLRLLARSPSYSSSSSKYEKPKSSTGWPRPQEIPFQAKVSNSVSFIGRINEPVQSKESPDNNFLAATVLSHTDFPSFRIPIVFEGNLAHTAACHLKVNDHVRIAGRLCADALPVDVNEGQVQVWVRADDINYVEESFHGKKSFELQKKKKELLPDNLEEEPLKDSGGGIKDGNSLLSSWKVLLDNPTKWWDYRSSKLDGSVNPKHPDFKRKDGGLSLWLDNKVPKWVMSKIEKVEFDVQKLKSKYEKQVTGDKHWKDLLNNPGKWWDNRTNKKNPKQPDFKQKDGDVSLWLDTAPKWVVSELEKVDFDADTSKPKSEKQATGDEHWKDLVDNPGKWWDNRVNKKNLRGPDFKHKDTKVALWLDKAPAWVLQRLPPLKSDQNGDDRNSQTILS